MFSWFIMGSQLMLGPKAAVCSSLWLIRPWSLLKKTEIRLKSYKFQWNIKHNAQDSHTLFSCLTNSPLYTQLNFRFALSFFFTYLNDWIVELHSIFWCYQTDNYIMPSLSQLWSNFVLPDHKQWTFDIFDT